MKYFPINYVAISASVLWPRRAKPGFISLLTLCQELARPITGDNSTTIQNVGVVTAGNTRLIEMHRQYQT